MVEKRAIKTEKAPQAIGAYSQGIVSGGFLFISGQIPLDPRSGEIVKGGIREQVERALENVKGILEGAGLGLSAVIKTTVYLSDLCDFAEMNEIYGRYFPHTPPARAAMGVSALPKGVRVEIEAVARMD